MILEKGLRVFGSSRSGRVDFEKTVELYREHPEIINYLSNIVGAVIPVRSIADMKKAFEMDIQKSFGKTIYALGEMRYLMIAVIVPIYNTEKYLRETIDSVICQTLSFARAYPADFVR